MSFNRYLHSIFFLVGVAAFPATTFSQAIHIDHTCTDISQIPEAWLSLARDVFRVHYAHTNYGEQITVGLERLALADPLLGYVSDYCNVPQIGTALSLMDGQWSDDYCETYVTPDLYWEGDNGMNVTRSVLNGFDVNVSLWSWQAQLDYFSETEAGAYLSAMATLESEYPGIRFVYMTGNAQSEEQNRVDRNAQIRQYCNANGKVLFDFADLDCWYLGEQHTVDGIPMEHPQYSGDEAGFTTYESCEKKAAAFWWLLARLAGWPGPDHLFDDGFESGNLSAWSAKSP